MVKCASVSGRVDQLSMKLITWELRSFGVRQWQLNCYNLWTVYGFSNMDAGHEATTCHEAHIFHDASNGMKVSHNNNWLVSST